MDNIWLSTDSRSEGDFDSIRVAAFNSIRKIGPISTNKFDIKEHFAVNYPKELSGAINLQISNFTQIMSQYLSDNLVVDVVLVTEKDKSFIDTELPKIIDPKYYGKNLAILDEYTSEQSFFSRSGTGGGTADYRLIEGKGYYLGNTASFATIRTFWPEIAPHEMAHVLQFYFAKGNENDCGEGKECSKWHGHMIEGSANTIGMAVAFPNLGWYSDEMDKILKNDIRTYGAIVPMNNTSDAVELCKLMETRTSQMNDSFAYSAGQLLWEYYVGKYGFPKLLELYSNTNKTSNFNENLKLTIGKDKLAFYQEAAPYLIATWKRLS